MNQCVIIETVWLTMNVGLVALPESEYETATMKFNIC